MNIIKFLSSVYSLFNFELLYFNVAQLIYKIYVQLLYIKIEILFTGLCNVSHLFHPIPFHWSNRLPEYSFRIFRTFSTNTENTRRHIRETCTGRCNDNRNRRAQLRLMSDGSRCALYNASASVVQLLVLAPDFTPVRLLVKRFLAVCLI